MNKKEQPTREFPTRFYATFGSGQPFFPGYMVIPTPDEGIARRAINAFVNGRWCGTYESLSQVHPLDRYYRGTLIPTNEPPYFLELIQDPEHMAESVKSFSSVEENF